jgi:threonine dehydratase
MPGRIGRKADVRPPCQAGAVTLTVGDVRAARERIAPWVTRTPIVDSHTLGRAVGGEVQLKAELFQRTGSFKVRGAINRALLLTDEERARGVATFSAGNHAQAAAYACGTLGVDCEVIMWATASPGKAEATRGYGATVDMTPPTPHDAAVRLDEVLARTGRVLIHPYDDEAVMAGAGTVGLEIAEDVPDVEVVVIPTSGGGLTAGTAVALRDAIPGVRVVAVQPAANPTLAASLAAGAAVTPSDPRITIADALTAPYLGRACFPLLAELVDDVVLLGEDEIAEGMRFTYARTKLAAEPGGSIGVAALLAGKVDADGAKVVCVMTGGNVTPETAAAILGGPPP